MAEELKGAHAREAKNAGFTGLSAAAYPADDQPKPVMSSRTVIAAVAVVVSLVAGQLGYAVADAEVAAIIDQGAEVVAIVAGIAAAIFRIKATHVIG